MRAEDKEKRSMSLQDAYNISQLIEENHDASIGINWDVIDTWTEYYYNNEKVSFRNH